MNIIGRDSSVLQLMIEETCPLLQRGNMLAKFIWSIFFIFMYECVAYIYHTLLLC